MKRKIIILIVTLFLLSSCASKRKTVSEVVQAKTKEIATETTREGRKAISEWIKKLAGSIVISEVEYYPPSDTVQAPQPKGAIKAERKTVVQLDTSERSKVDNVEESVTDKTAVREERTNSTTRVENTVEVKRSYTLRLMLLGIVVGVLVSIYVKRNTFSSLLKAICRVFMRK